MILRQGRIAHFVPNIGSVVVERFDGRITEKYGRRGALRLEPQGIVPHEIHQSEESWARRHRVGSCAVLDGVLHLIFL